MLVSGSRGGAGDEMVDMLLLLSLAPPLLLALSPLLLLLLSPPPRPPQGWWSRLLVLPSVASGDSAVATVLSISLVLAMRAGGAGVGE